MDQTNRAVPHRRPRRGALPQTDSFLTDSQDSRLSLANLPDELQTCDQESKPSGWSRINIMPNVFSLQRISLLRFGTSGSRQRLVVTWLAFLYLGFSLISFKPLSLHLELQRWRSSSTLPEYGIWSFFPKSQPPALGIMETTLVLSKLSPYLGTLPHDVLQPILIPDARSETSDLSITTCISIPSTHLDILDSWTDLSGCQISVLITSSDTPGSPDHQRLVKEIQGIIKQKPGLRGSVILMSTPIISPNPNTYINLARLFSQSSWSLLIPPTLTLLPGDEFSLRVSELELRTHVTSPKLAFKMTGTKAGSNLDSVLIPRGSPIWCSEQYSALTPAQEWTKCIQELLHHDPESGTVGQAA